VKMDDLVPEAGDLESFIKQFEVFARAPGGVEELRDLIFKLAIRGLLLPSVMEVVDHAELNEGFKIFTLPKDWKIESIEKVISNKKWAIKRGPFGSAIKKSFFVESGYKVYEQQHAIYDDFSRGDYYVNEEKFQELKAFQIHPKDLIISCSGTVGRVAEAPLDMEEGIINQALLKVSLNQDLLLNNYFKVLFKAYFMNTPELLNLKGTAQKNMVSVKTLKSLPFPLPPLEEQKRIVAKVDELIVLCDTLEAQQQQQAKTVLRANTAAINALLNPAPQSEQNSPKTTEKETNTTPENSFEQNWQRIAQHFNTLYGCTLPMPKGQGRKKKYLVGLENVKGLKNVILGLAVSGKLTNQLKASDVNAAFSNNQQEKKRQIKDKVIKKKKELLGFKKNEEPHAIPSSWMWTRIGVVTNYGSASKLDLSGVQDKSWVLELEDIEKETSKLLVKVKAKDRPFKSTKNKFTKGDVLYGKLRPYLDKVLVADTDGVCSTEIIPLHGFSDIDSNYLFWVMKSPYFKEYADNSTHGMGMPRMGTDKGLAAPFPFPPLEEQKRIVSKVDQLMTLCDQLKQQLTQSYSDAEKLMQATVKALVA